MNKVRKNSEPVPLKYKLTSADHFETKEDSLSTTVTKKTSSLKVPKRYIDELGFYRQNKQIDDYDQFYRSVRRDLRISHFDRTHNHLGWKNNWDVFIKNKLVRKEPVTLNNEFKIKCRSGIPQDYRRKVWTALINMRVKSIKEQCGQDLYARLIASSFDDKLPTKSANNSNLQPVDKSATHLDKCSKQIELDLLRTLPNNKHFDQPESMGIQRVRRVLRAFAKYNPTVGYCQGMNRLAAVALLILPEEDAFWCLVAIVECIMPRDYYVKPWLAQVDCGVLNDLLASKMPRLHKHLVSNDVDLTLFTWFFTVFVDGFKPELTLRIWDCYLLEGDKVLFRFALALIQIAQEKLLQMNDFATMNSYLHKLGSSNNLDIEHLFQTFESLNPFSARTVQTKRALHHKRVKATFDE